MKYRTALLFFVTLAIPACGGQVAPSDPGPGVQNGPGPNIGVDPPAQPPVSEPGGKPAPPTTPAPEPAQETPQAFPWVASCPAAPVDSWGPAAAPTGSVDDLRAYADAVKASFAGHWKGKQSIFGTNPTVAFSFESNGHYSGMCLDAGQCWATIYNGTDNESPFKKFVLDDMSLAGVSSGNIDLAFPPQPAMGENPSDPPYVPAAGTNVLKNVVLDASGNRLRFDLVSYMQSPPFVAQYDLWRCP